MMSPSRCGNNNAMQCLFALQNSGYTDKMIHKNDGKQTHFKWYPMPKRFFRKREVPAQQSFPLDKMAL